ncbi:hypothetical protein CKAH01_02289 [Colletotrichum kahawae]|uniref:Uncharacterized protein n=1 Tax=Colletotrichum kahawae TaxID=34407 RepID=A0AAD9XY60_COLKA|nr:hypothetical protein CKAH01_02289 [Colletotrichum kahawae]
MSRSREERNMISVADAPLPSHSRGVEEGFEGRRKWTDGMTTASKTPSGGPPAQRISQLPHVDSRDVDTRFTREAPPAPLGEDIPIQRRRDHLRTIPSTSCRKSPPFPESPSPAGPIEAILVSSGDVLTQPAEAPSTICDIAVNLPAVTSLQGHLDRENASQHGSMDNQQQAAFLGYKGGECPLLSPHASQQLIAEDHGGRGSGECCSTDRLVISIDPQQGSAARVGLLYKSGGSTKQITDLELHQTALSPGGGRMNTARFSAGATLVREQQSMLTLRQLRCWISRAICSDSGFGAFMMLNQGWPF